VTETKPIKNNNGIGRESTEAPSRRRRLEKVEIAAFESHVSDLGSRSIAHVDTQLGLTTLSNLNAQFIRVDAWSGQAHVDQP
jgi:hypothetical protein